jgi:hypothetical protein
MKKYLCTDNKYLSFVILSDIDNVLEVNKYLNPYLYVSETDLSPKFFITNKERDDLTRFSDDYSYNENIVCIKNRKVVALKRVILDLYSRLLEYTYSCDFYHASSVDMNGARVFVGNRGAGKTYNMIQGVMNGGNFISNDKVALIDNNVVGFPTTIGIRRKTLLLFDQYREQFKKDGSIDIIQQEKNDTYNKLLFTVSDFCKLFGCGITQTTKLSEIVYLSDMSLKECIVDSVYDEQQFIKEMIKVRK